jgi:hypothetical protein
MRRILEDRVIDPMRFYVNGDPDAEPTGMNEETEWTFDFPNLEESRLDLERGLDVARLELCLTPKRQYFQNDSVQIKGLSEIHLAATGLLPHLELNKTVSCNFDLLQFYNGQDILNAFWKDDQYHLSMLYQEDAIIHDAYIRLEQWEGAEDGRRASVRMVLQDQHGSTRFAWCLALEADSEG